MRPLGLARWVWGTIVLIAVASLASCSSPSQDSTPTASGIIFITVDGLVPDHVSLFGGPLETPSLTQMAAEGRAWKHGWSSVPMTRPAIATYFTGQTPERHEVLDDLNDALVGIPTIGAKLGEAGYKRGAFVGSGMLGRSSGLLEDFDIVDEPLPVMGANRRWNPSMRPAKMITTNLLKWVRTIPEGEKYFAWLHIVRPLRSQLAVDEDAAERGFVQFQEAMSLLLQDLQRREDFANTAIVLAGTMGLVAPDGVNDPGIGFSLNDKALQVPVLLRMPSAAETLRRADAVVWAPDVTETLADLGGVEIATDGVSLFEEAPAERILVSMSRAPLDQLGWQVLKAARKGDTFVQTGGVEQTRGLRGQVPSEADSAELKTVLEGVTFPERVTIPLEAVEPLLSTIGVEVDPAPADGRVIDPAKRREYLESFWEARRLGQFNRLNRSMAQYEEFLKLDPEALAPNVDLGFYLTISGETEKGAVLLDRAASLYPTSPEVLRWYSISKYGPHLDVGEQLLQLVHFARPDSGDVLYDLACGRSLQGDVEGAEMHLRSAVEAGFRDFDLMAQDRDLRAIRDSGRLVELMREFQR